MDYMLFKFIFFSLFCNFSFCENEDDYYWRDYMGKIPSDAIPGGRDINNKTTYIGQVYVKEWGIIPVQIYPGVKSVVANIWGLHKSDSYIKILCSSSRENFKWVPANRADLHIKLMDKHLVRGGTEYGYVTHIGRILYQNAVVVGKVCTFNVGNALMFFPYGNQEKNAESYEILIYEPNKENVEKVSVL